MACNFNVIYEYIALRQSNFSDMNGDINAKWAANNNQKVSNDAALGVCESKKENRIFFVVFFYFRLFVRCFILIPQASRNEIK